MLPKSKTMPCWYHFNKRPLFFLSGPLPVANRQKIQDGLDPAVLIDAIATCMAHEEKELCKTGQLAMSFIVETAATVLGSKQRVGSTFCHCQLY